MKWQMVNAFPMIFLKDMLEDMSMDDNQRFVWHKDGITYIATSETIIEMAPDIVDPADSFELWVYADENDET